MIEFFTAIQNMNFIDFMWAVIVPLAIIFRLGYETGKRMEQKG